MPSNNLKRWCCWRHMPTGNTSPEDKVIRLTSTPAAIRAQVPRCRLSSILIIITVESQELPVGATDQSIMVPLWLLKRSLAGLHASASRELQRLRRSLECFTRTTVGGSRIILSGASAFLSEFGWAFCATPNRVVFPRPACFVIGKVNKQSLFLFLNFVKSDFEWRWWETDRGIEACSFLLVSSVKFWWHK